MSQLRLPPSTSRMKRRSMLLRRVMCKVERDGDAGDAVGREPLLRQPAVRPKADAAGGELSIQPLDRLLEIGARDRQSEITKSQTKQLVVATTFPRRAARP